MRARSAPEIASVNEALVILGLAGPADPLTLAAAFRHAVKTARPDQAGGDAERFRRVILAYRLIQAEGAARLALAAPAVRPAPLPVIGLTPLQAVGGARVTVALNSRTMAVAVPPGLRTGEHLRLRGGARDGSDIYLPVLIRAADGLWALGDDLYMSWAVPRRLIEDGGRLSIDTHAGLRDAWIVGGMGSDQRLRLKGLGLPARGRRPQGHLFVALTPSADAPSAAEDMLARFARHWAPERLAA